MTLPADVNWQKMQSSLIMFLGNHGLCWMRLWLCSVACKWLNGIVDGRRGRRLLGVSWAEDANRKP